MSTVNVSVRLTGRVRYRTGVEGFMSRKPILVLQVEEHHLGTVDHWDSIGGRVECDIRNVNKLVWRDAVATDLSLVAPCKPVQHSDQVCCERCRRAWDVNDPYPPTCPPGDE